MANAVVPDRMGNILVVIIPFDLYGTCIRENAYRLKSIADCKVESGTYKVNDVPKLFSDEPIASTEILSLADRSEL